MNTSACRRAVVFLTGAFLLLMLTPAWTDWQPGDPYKMHYPQLPNPIGWDVDCTQYLLADDWGCIESGFVTNIHLWVSWMGADEGSGIFNIHLSIHADDTSGLYSKPRDPPLWTADLMSGGFSNTYRMYGVGQEGWYDPGLGTFQPLDHTNFYQINCIDFTNPFYQEVGKLYWLDVQITTLNPQERVGWKTSASMHFQDDAVWWDGVVMNDWLELRDPISSDSLDMAFVIDGGMPEHVREMCPKWIQPPDCDIGVDVASWSVPGAPVVISKVADDWLCDGRPVTAVRWWGSYIGWEATNSSGQILPPAQQPAGFLLTWYTDVPAGATPYSMPGSVLATNYLPLGPFGYPVPGYVYENTQCVSELNFLDPTQYEHEYVYYAELTNDWNEKEGRVYWLSVEAIYTGEFTYAWGWKTTPLPWNWNDDAVNQGGSGLWTNMLYPPPGWEQAMNHPYKGESVNMAFELLSDICPARCKKWAQPPDMTNGENMASWRYETNSGTLRADDFISDGRPITDIHWWGSYLTWYYVDPGSETNPIPPPRGDNAPLGFTLSWHQHDEGSCMPTDLISSVFVNITNCHEAYYGSVTQYWEPGPFTVYEHEYQYYVDLLETGIETPWLETNGVHYWLDIQAVFSTNFFVGEHRGWGWKITPSNHNQECRSAVRDEGGMWRNEMIEAPNPRAGEQFDLAFELTTTNIPPTNGVLVVFTNMAATAAVNSAYLWTTGHCGCGRQVLQESSSLRVGEPGWSDVATNALPRQENFWSAAPLSTQRFYRVIQVP